MNRLVVVGSGTVIPEGDRGGSCYFVELDGSRVLLDCGPGAVQSLARHGLPWDGLTDLVLTHFHGDHVGALPGLFFSLTHGASPERDGTLRVWGPTGTRALFRGLASALGDYMLDPGFPVEIRDVAPGERIELSGGPSLEVCRTPHTEESVAVRLEAGDAVVAYTGDTGPMPELGAFMAGADILVAECSLTEEEVGDNHLSPTSVAEIAQRAEPGILLLTHVYPHVRRSVDLSALVKAAGWVGPVEVVADGDEHRLPAD